MSALSVDMKEALLKGNVKYFGDLLHESWEVKKKINDEVTNKLVEDYYATARDLGALGGKLLGAGNSGYILFYASPPNQKAIRDALEEKAAQESPLRFSATGLEVWTTNR